jgi:hypothetical protein
MEVECKSENINFAAAISTVGEEIAYSIVIMVLRLALDSKN